MTSQPSTTKGLWLRVLFCWALGSTFLFFDEVDNYDLRFRLRGSQPTDSRIVLVTFEQDDWNAWHGPSENWKRLLKEFTVPSESSFWHSQTWNQLLGRILQQHPQQVGVTFFFNPQLPRPIEEYVHLSDPRVIWAGQLDSEGRPAYPLMAGPYAHNVALVDLREDKDHMIRRFSSPLAPLPHLALKLSENETGGSVQELNALFGATRLINFRGGADIYPSISALAVLQNQVPADFFKDKIVLIGTHSVPSHQYQTPVGRLSRAELLAQIIDNVIGKRWIQQPHFVFSALYLLVILILATVILSSYPQSVAFVFLFWLGLGSTALSLWVFDSFYLWLPAFSGLLMISLTYVIFLGFQLSIKENQAWRLEKERQLLSEVDQLRNNFVSLISHDLKTPIAKIQAICDRLLADSLNEDTRLSLLNLRKESVELHRYIQSILQLSRLESDSVSLRKEATDLNDVVENVVDQISPLAKDKRQDVLMDLEPLFAIDMDSVLIREVVLNLVENAVKYTPNDGRIQVQTQEVDDKVVFAVKDSGPGIPPQDRDHIFDKFFRGQAAQTQIKGTGLGLFLVKYFVELHGGEVFLESDLGKGTRVGFTLPLQT